MAEYNMREAVDAGLAWLDWKYGRRWVDGIHLGSLSLSSCDECIVGQLLGNYEMAAGGWKLLGAFDLGFCIPHWWLPESYALFYRALTAMWKRRILEMRLELELETIKETCREVQHA